MPKMKSFICKSCMNPVTGIGHTNLDIGVNANLELVDIFCYLGKILSVDGNADATAETKIQIGWNKFKQLVPLLTNKGISLIVEGDCTAVVCESSTLHGSETWPLIEENEEHFNRQR